MFKPYLAGLSLLLLTACHTPSGDTTSPVGTTPPSENPNPVTTGETAPSNATDSPTEGGTPTDRASELQQRLRNAMQQNGASSESTAGTAGNSSDTAEISMFTMQIAPYNAFLDANGYLSLAGVSLDRIQTELGDAPVVVRMARPGAPLRREVRVYFPYDEDPTGLYIFIRNESVVSFRLDEFSGLENPAIQAFFNESL